LAGHGARDLGLDLVHEERVDDAHAVLAHVLEEAARGAAALGVELPVEALDGERADQVDVHRTVAQEVAQHDLDRALALRCHDLRRDDVAGQREACDAAVEQVALERLHRVLSVAARARYDEEEGHEQGEDQDHPSHAARLLRAGVLARLLGFFVGHQQSSRRSAPSGADRLHRRSAVRSRSPDANAGSAHAAGAARGVRG
jgi:hypothetical protein